MKQMFLRSLIIGLSSFGFTCIASCTINMHGNGEAGFRQSTSWGFYHETELDENGIPQSSISVESKPLLDYLAKESTPIPDVSDDDIE